MLEHIHLLVSEPARDTLADAPKSLKQGVTRRLIEDADHFWQKRYYDFNVRNEEQFTEKLHYIHGNPVKQGSCASPEDWPWNSFSIMRLAAMDGLKLSPSGRRANASGQQEDSVQASNFPTQANVGLEWGTPPSHLVGPRIQRSYAVIRVTVNKRP